MEYVLHLCVSCVHFAWLMTILHGILCDITSGQQMHRTLREIFFRGTTPRGSFKGLTLGFSLEKARSSLGPY